MFRKRTALGALTALVGGFAIARLTSVFDLSPGVAALGYGALVVGLLLFQLGRETRDVGSAHRPR